MYIPELDNFNKEVETLSLLNDTYDKINNMHRISESFLNDLPGPKQTEEWRLKLRKKYSVPRKQSNSDSDFETQKAVLVKETDKIIRTAQKAAAVQSNKEAFELIRSNHHNTFNGYFNLFKMAHQYVKEVLEDLSSESAYFAVSSEIDYTNHLPVLKFYIRPSQTEEVRLARVLLTKYVYSLHPKGYCENLSLKLIYPTSFSEKMKKGLSLRTDELLLQFSKTEHSIQRIRSCSFLPKSYRLKKERQHLFVLKRLLEELSLLEQYVEVQQQNANIYFGKKDILEKRKDIQEDFERYINKINEKLGTSIEFDIEVINK